MMVDSSSLCVKKLIRKLNLQSTNYAGFSIDRLGHMKLEKAVFSQKKILKENTIFTMIFFFTNSFVAFKDSKKVTEI
jgi:hypothetical protein